MVLFCARCHGRAGVNFMLPMKLSEKALLYRELAKLVGASFHLDRSIDLLLKQQPSHARRTWLQGLQLGLKEGKGVAAAMTEHCGAFSDALEFALIDAGERSGRLGDAFSHLSRYFEAWNMAVKQAIGAMIYPLVLAHLGIILPELPMIVTATMEDKPYSTAGIFMPLAILWLVLLSLFLLWRWLSRLGAQSAPVDLWLSRLPLIGSARRHWALARFCQVFHACLLASMRMTECMELAGSASHSGLLRHAAQDAARRIATGETIAGAMADVHGFPLIFVHGIATAEETGTLDHEMNRWAAAETIEAGDAVQRAAQWLPKIAYAVVVLYVAYRILTMMSGYYGGMMKQMEGL